MVKVRVQIRSEIGPRIGQEAQVVVETSYSELVKLVQKTFQLKSLNDVALYLEDGDLGAIHEIPHGDLSDLLQNDANILISRKHTNSGPFLSSSYAVNNSKMDDHKRESGVGNFTQSQLRTLPSKIFLIGIGGPSGCGKSTLAAKLVNRLNSPIIAISLDWYNGIGVTKDSNGKRNFETPDTIDFESFRQDISRIAAALAHGSTEQLHIVRPRQTYDLHRDHIHTLSQEVVPIVVEGFLLFHDSGLSGMCNVQVWLEADCEECLIRRYRRSGQKKALSDFSNWYRDHVWKHFLMYRDAQLLNSPDALHLNTQDSVDVLVRKTMSRIQSLMRLQNCSSVDDRLATTMIEDASVESVVERDIGMQISNNGCSSEDIIVPRTPIVRLWKTRTSPCVASHSSS